MSAEHAVGHDADTGTDTGNPIANVTVYWRVSAMALAGVALLGLLINALGGNNAYVPNLEIMESILVFDWTHNVVHVALFAVAALFGFGSFSQAISANAAKVVGIVYLALGIAGFSGAFVGMLDGLIHLHLEAGENIIHLALGGWGAYAGFAS